MPHLPGSRAGAVGYNPGACKVLFPNTWPACKWSRCLFKTGKTQDYARFYCRNLGERIMIVLHIFLRTKAHLLPLQHVLGIWYNPNTEVLWMLMLLTQSIGGTGRQIHRCAHLPSHSHWCICKCFRRMWRVTALLLSYLWILCLSDITSQTSYNHSNL